MLKNRSNLAVPVKDGSQATSRPRIRKFSRVMFCQANITWNSGW
ncbi:hypothetical protein BZZ08_07324 [Streptomyces sp. MH60]|nr:hypothetical protein BZZ08_07324 [Streptomyces sp. MH60]